MVRKAGRYITTLLNGLSFKAKDLILKKKFDTIRSKISPFSLIYDPSMNQDFSEMDLNNSSSRFLNYYTYYGIDLALESYGIKRKLKQLGFKNLQYLIKIDNAFHTLSIYDQFKTPENLIIQLALSIKKEYNLGEHFCKALTINWLLLQDYKQTFTSKRLPFPGQNYPGLGFARVAFEVVVQIAKRLNIPNIVASPDHFHNAVIYSSHLYFKNPVDKALTINILKRYPYFSLPSLSWLVYNGALKHQDDQILNWEPELMFSPTFSRSSMHKFFLTEFYKKTYKIAKLQYNPYIDFNNYEENRDNYPVLIQWDIDRTREKFTI